MSGTRQPRRLPWLCLLLAIWMPAAADAAGEYRVVEVESLRIALDSTWANRTAPGYLPVRFDITNLGADRVIEIVGEGSRFFRGARGGQPGFLTIRQAVRLAHGDRVRLVIPVPVYADSENIRFEVREDGRVLERFNYNGFQSRLPPADAATLIVADPGSPFGALASSLSRTFAISPTAGRGVRSTPPVDFVLEPPRVPANWLGFTSLRAVVVGAGEWQQLTEAQRTALLTWTACGGDLFFIDGNLKALLPAASDTPPGGAGSVPRGYFFGRIHLRTAASLTSEGLGTALAASEKLQDPNWALPVNRALDWGKIVWRGFRLPIPGVDAIPARAYLSILIAFTFLIGPVNYWLLWRTRQQVLIVLTAPLIAAIFIVLLGAYVIAGEGMGVRGRAVTFTMLDEVRKQAATRASVSLYAAGMTPAGGLRFARESAVFPIGADGTGSADRLALDLSESQNFTGGIIQARSPANFEQISFRPARERLGLNREPRGLVVVNGLGETIVALLYRDRDTTYTLSAALPAGGREVMTAGALAPQKIVPANLPLSSRFEHLIEHQPPGSYIAVLERSPFWNPGVVGISERSSFHVVLGWPGGQP